VKILFLTDGIHPFQLGGMQKHSLILSRLLAERDVWIHLYHIGGEGYSKESFADNYGAEMSYIKEFHIPFPKTDRLPGHYIRENKKYSELIYSAVKDKIDDFDLIYAQGFTGWHFIKQKKKGKISIPILVNFHGFEMYQKAASTKVKLEQQLFKKAIKFNVLNADGVYSFGGKLDLVLKKIGVAQDKILLQSNGIEESWLVNLSSNEIRNQKRTLTFVGRNERRKGIEELNKSLAALVKRKDLSFVFNFIGPIPEEVKIKDDRIIYHGEIRDTDAIKEILQHSDCLVCPSHSEGMPTVILEGMASGLAIIATDVGAISRQMKENGILLESPDPKKLKLAILEIIQMNVEHLNKMKQNSIQRIEDHFLWEVIADKKITQFRRVLGTKA
jgi:glycosyltransferase involved in cell wall biosynthesis